MKKIMTAFDMDFLNNPHVQKGYCRLVRLLEDAGIPFGTYLWDPAYKGLDDYIWHSMRKQTKINFGIRQSAE